MRFSSLLLFILLLSVTVTAQYDIHWVGGPGAWDDPDKWDTQSVPNYKSNVFIGGASSQVVLPAGFATDIHYLNLSGGASLQIDGELTVKTTNPYLAINNTESHLDVHGRLAIYGEQLSSQTAYRSHLAGQLTVRQGADVHIEKFGYGIKLYNTSDAQISGAVVSREVAQYSLGLLQQSTCRVYSSGLLSIRQGTDAIRVLDSGSLQNDGDIIVDGAISSAGLSNHSTFLNTNTGTLTIEDSGPTAINNRGDIENQGTIVIRSDGSFSNYLGDVDNTTSGFILMDANNNQTGTLVVTGATQTIDNAGLISIQHPQNSGLLVTDRANFLNQSGARLWIEHGTGNNGGISLDESYFENAGYIRININGTNGINLSGSTSQLGLPRFLNQYCGIIDVRGGRLSTFDGNLTNHAWLFLKDAGANHIFSGGSFNNTGVVADRFGTLGGLNFTNQGLVTRPLQGPLVANQTINNALTWGGNSSIGAPSMRTSRNGPGAGTYSLPANTYTPNSAAVGDSELWLRVGLQGCGSKWFRIPVENAAPLQGAQEPQSFAAAPAGKSWHVYPNPASTVVQLLVPELVTNEASLQLSLHSLDGRVQQQDHLTVQPGTTISLVRPTHLPAGTYTLRIVVAGEAPIIRRVVWQ